MKLVICVFCMLTAGWLQAQDSFYDLFVVSSSGKLVSMSAYKGKKVLIVVAGPAALNPKSSARYLGAIQSAYPQIEVLILPSDIGTDSSAMAEIKPSSALTNTTFSTGIASGKNKTAEWHPLLQWLTMGSRNRHFEKKDIVSDEQFYVISESGVLYAVLEKGVSDAFLNVVLTAADVKPQQVITDINRQGSVNPR